MKYYDDWYANLPLYKKINIQREFHFENWDILTDDQKSNIYHNMLYELHIDGPVEFYQEEWLE